MSEWISVDVKMPPKMEDVQVFCSDTGEQFVAFINRGGDFQFGITPICKLICNPTHWMPLPEPPKEMDK